MRFKGLFLAIADHLLGYFNGSEPKELFELAFGPLGSFFLANLFYA